MIIILSGHIIAVCAPFKTFIPVFSPIRVLVVNHSTVTIDVVCCHIAGVGLVRPYRICYLWIEKLNRKVLGAGCFHFAKSDWNVWINHAQWTYPVTDCSAVSANCKVSVHTQHPVTTGCKGPRC